jgi:glycosyltransferase involved in cell wall biosynthesis
MKPEQLDLTITTYSNSPNVPTGYGTQIKQVIEGLARHGVNVSHASNYGQEGINGKYKTPSGEVPHYARGYDPMSQDALAVAHNIQTLKRDCKDYILTLCDVWVLTHNLWKEKDFPRILSWIPLDHISMPPKVKKWIDKPNVTSIAMSPFGLEQLKEVGVEGHYIPHSVDTVNTFKPTAKIGKQNAREFLGLKDDDFLIVSNSANKANLSIHRKCFPEMLISFAIFRQKVPNAFLYLHTEPTGVFGGFHLPRIAAACGLPMDSVIFPDPVDYRIGLNEKDLAGIYTAADIGLQVSLGGGYEIPIMEMQSVGRRVIVSQWTGPRDLIAPDSFAVTGQMSWDEAQSAWWKMPSINSIVTQLENAYDEVRAKGKDSNANREFAKDFDTVKVWNQYWLPFLRTLQ